MSGCLETSVIKCKRAASIDHEKIFVSRTLCYSRSGHKHPIAKLNMSEIQSSHSDPMPLVELHCHLEGTVKPLLAQELAARHGTDLSDVIDSEGRYVWNDFATFLHAYDATSGAIRTPKDYYDITYAYYTEAAACGLRYGEVFVSPAHAERHGISYPTLIESISTAFDDIEKETGAVGRIILTFVRHYGVDHAEKIARLPEEFQHPSVVGFGMAGEENAGHPRDFAPVFDIARGADLKVTAHAGELMGPESVRAVINDLDVDRIGHGVRSREDPALVEELAARGLALELCPSSNVCMNVFASIADHPVKDYLRAGLNVSLSTDDPAFFGDTIRTEYDDVAAAHSLSAIDLIQFSRNAMQSAFCGSDVKNRILGEIEAWAARNGAKA